MAKAATTQLGQINRIQEAFSKKGVTAERISIWVKSLKDIMIISFAADGDSYSDEELSLLREDVQEGFLAVKFLEELQIAMEAGD